MNWTPAAEARLREVPFFVRPAVRRRVEKLAAEAGCSTAQLSLAWVLSRGEHVVPIPGTTSVAHLRENVAAATLAVDPALLAAVGALMPPSAVSGGRYGAVGQSEVDTEEF